ncbi:hypothetical protein BJ875DRAFT_484605 [Amylocarpus encephaloides]|uniref:Mediator complex subunit 15 KIX domain-containing protein n=1 Tax=Amylocarpus encephaloides TaxID=45428 RepID=A0A9P8C4U4_9HELO|nr:hypothetical protein BJ875DRAFT_484605 [Amylocarpus encephaloides]
MDSTNFQPHNMVGPAQIQQQRRPQQQRPGGPVGNVSQHLQQFIYTQVSQQTGQRSGWQAQVLIQERIGLIFNIIGNLRLASQIQPIPPGLPKMVEIGIKFEKEIFDKSLDKVAYKRSVEAKLEQLLERRNQNQAGLQHSINAQAQAQAQAQQQAQAQMMMNQNGMQGQQRPMPEGIPNAQMGQQGFQHLQHQMQASPLPGQQQQQMLMGMGNDSLPPNLAQNQQQQFQMSMQQSQQPPNAFNRPHNGPQQIAPQDQAVLTELANRLMNQASTEEKVQIRTRMIESMTPQALQELQLRHQDPLILYYRNQALHRFRQDKQTRMMAQQQQQQTRQLAMSQVQGLPNGGQPMQQTRSSMNPSPMNGQNQPATSMGGNNDFNSSFMGSADSLVAQQQQAVIAEQKGQVVVPGAAPRNGTPQPGTMAGQPMGLGMNNQPGVPNPMNRTQQQQILHAQQLQRQQTLHAQQQQQNQAQVQARMAQAKQQMGLQGQPGGMGNGPMPSQQSPALPTLNAPLRTPSQMSHPELPQGNPNPHMGQLDPRFAATNQRGGLMGSGAGIAAGGLNPAMFVGMSREQQQKMAGLSQDKVQEVLAKFQEQRGINPTNQAARSQMPQVGNQMHPGGQMPPGGQFNHGQFMMGGQRAPQGSSSITPQQQMVLQEQIARLQQQGNPQQRPAIPQLPPQMEQQIVRQMDDMDFPLTLQNHATFPRGVPPDVKKWGPLKQWVQQNPVIGPEIGDNLRQLQKVHWQSLLRSRQQGQVGGMQPGMQPSQAGMPSIPPGMSAPVAPMGPNSMHPGAMNMGGAGQMAQPTQQEMQNARQHPSGKMAHATDEQIKMFVMKQRAMLLRQQNVQIRNQPTQLNNQQPRPGQQLQNRGPPQGQPPQPKQALPVAEPPNANASAQNANRAARPAPNPARGAIPNSSPAQPPKNLKRAQSDDVIEVPNPNMSQPARPAPPQAQAPQAQAKKPAGQQNRNLTPQEVAALDPEARKRYETNIIMAQHARAQQALKLIMVEEQQKSALEPFEEVPMNAEAKATVTKLLRDGLLQPLMNMAKAMPRWYQMTQDDNRARTFYALHNRLAKQFHDPQMTRPKDTFSISVKDIENARSTLNGMVKDLSQRHPNMLKHPQGAQAAATPNAAPANQQATPAPGVPLNAANLQQQQQQLDKLHQRSGSRSHAPPAAPTTAQAPFQFGGAKSPPDDVSAYISKPLATQKDLQLPARKRQKQGTGHSTPASNASPQVAKAISPEMKRQADIKQQPKPTLSCSEPECDKHKVAFETDEALRRHTQEEHIKPLADPLQYAQQNLAALLNLDSRGQSRNPTVTQDASAPPTAPKMVSAGSKQGQSLNPVKSGNTPAAGTPMGRQTSMHRQGSAMGARPGAESKGTQSKDGLSKAAPDQKESNKQETQQEPSPTFENPWANATIDPHDLFTAFQPFASGGGGAISNMDAYRAITPNDTPESSKDSGVSEPNSDISDGANLDINIDIFNDNWHPFGPSDPDVSFFGIPNFGMSIDDNTMFDDQQPSQSFQWDDFDTSSFDKPFSFDTSMYSMNAE